MSDNPQSAPNTEQPPVNMTAFDRMFDAQPPVPAAPAVPTAQPAPNAAQEGIRDEAAYYKAQAEKFERLLKKATEPAAPSAPPATQPETDRLAQLEQELKALRQEAKEERVQMARDKALDQLGLKGDARDAAAAMLTATTPDGIQEQAAKIKALLPPQTGRIGNSGQAPQPAEEEWLKQYRERIMPSGVVFDPNFHRQLNGGVVKAPTDKE